MHVTFIDGMEVRGSMFPTPIFLLVVFFPTVLIVTGPPSRFKRSSLLPFSSKSLLKLLCPLKNSYLILRSLVSPWKCWISFTFYPVLSPVCIWIPLISLPLPTRLRLIRTSLTIFTSISYIILIKLLHFKKSEKTLTS